MSARLEWKKRFCRSKQFGSHGEEQFSLTSQIMQKKLSVVQKIYNLIIWFVPLLNKFPRNHKFTRGDRIQNQIYDIFEELILAKYGKEKLARLENVNGKLDVLRYLCKLLLDFKLIDGKRFYHASSLINEIGVELGGWLKQQKK